jgi:hypothetical protein
MGDVLLPILTITRTTYEQGPGGVKVKTVRG